MKSNALIVNTIISKPLGVFGKRTTAAWLGLGCVTHLCGGTGFGIFFEKCVADSRKPASKNAAW